MKKNLDHINFLISILIILLSIVLISYFNLNIEWIIKNDFYSWKMISLSIFWGLLSFLILDSI